MNLEYLRIPAGIYQANCYLVYDPDTKEAVLIDPAGDEKLIREQIETVGADIRAILLTHGHGDHVGAVEAMRQSPAVDVYAHSEERALLGDPKLNLSASMFAGPVSLAADHWFEDEDLLPFLGGIRVVHTPGHTAGSCCFMTPHFLFSGDTLFVRSIGRTDLPTSDEGQLRQSLEKIKALPPNLEVLPGHGPGTILEKEIRYNSFLQ